MRLLPKQLCKLDLVQENKEVIEEQLQTIEEMVEYIKDQPISVQNTEREDVMIENLLFETEQTQQTMEEIESLMNRFNEACAASTHPRPKIMLLHHTYVAADSADAERAA